MDKVKTSAALGWKVWVGLLLATMAVGKMIGYFLGTGLAITIPAGPAAGTAIDHALDHKPASIEAARRHGPWEDYAKRQDGPWNNYGRPVAPQEARALDPYADQNAEMARRRQVEEDARTQAKAIAEELRRGN